MRLKIAPPVVLENLLPYDFKYRIYDKNTKKDWSNFLRRGGVSPVHMVELSHLLLLSVDYGKPGQEDEGQGEQNLALLGDQPSLARRPSQHDGGNNVVVEYIRRVRLW